MKNKFLYEVVIWQDFQPEYRMTMAHSIHARYAHGTRTMSTCILNGLAGWYRSVAASLSSCSRMARWEHHDSAARLLQRSVVRARSPTLFRSFDLVV